MLCAMSAIPCSYCSGEFFSPSEELLLTHIRLVHSSDPGFSIQCSEQGCSRYFSSFKAYQNHRRLKHGSNNTADQPTLDANEEVEDLDCTDIEAHNPSVPSTEDMQHFSSRWILKTRETRKLSRAAMQGVIEDVGDLVTFISGTLESQTRATLRANGVSSQLMSGLEEVFSGPATKPFAGLQSFHQQLQYCRKHFDFIVSKQYIQIYTCMLS